MSEIYATRKALRSLRMGIVPSSHVLQLAVGISGVNPLLDNGLRKLRSGSPPPLRISGEWGSGKSTLLAYIRNYVLERNLASAYVCLNGQTTPMNHPQRFYPALMNSLRFPNSAERGILSLFGILSSEADICARAKEWLIANESRSEFASAFHNYLIEPSEGALQVILGMDLYWADYKKEKALDRIEDVAKFFRALGYGGLMLQFDELETMIQLWNVRSRRGAYRQLDRLVRSQNVWVVLASSPRLDHLLSADLSSETLMGKEEMLIRKYQQLDVLETPAIDKPLALELMKRVESLYRSVYDDMMITHEPLDGAIIQTWMQTASHDPRRLIRIIVERLDRSRRIVTHRILDSSGTTGET